jgi:polysaccharide biosynthesis protein PslH
MTDRPVRTLFVKERMAWPRASGHDVHTYYLMQALGRLGHPTALATVASPPAEAVSDGGTERLYCYDDTDPPAGDAPLRLTPRQEKFRSYWGIDADRVRWVAAAAADFGADAVVVSGLNVLPYLGALPADTVKVWYAADEWVWHHLSQVRPFRRSTWAEVKPAVVKGLYERAYRSLVDRTWVVTPADARAFRWVVGSRPTDVMPNGVDADHYTPGPEPEAANTCTFWGRLDFGPNVQAVEWFVAKVWPRVRATVPAAAFRIYGFQPTPPVHRLAGRDGITLTPDLPDIRPAVRGGGVVVLPFVSGGGIKNKLLEAAAMGRPIVCTPRVLEGLGGRPPFPAAADAARFADELVTLWRNDLRRTSLGAAARDWVREHHTWEAAARVAAAGLQATAAERPALAGAGR